MATLQEEIVYAGELNRYVKLFKHTFKKNGSNEAVPTNVEICRKFVKRIEVSGSENDDNGRIRSLSICRFIMRYDKDILKNGTEYFIKDLDGDYYINSVSVMSRNRFLTCQAERRDAGK